MRYLSFISLRRLWISLTVFMLLSASPLVAMAQLVPCDGSVERPCNFSALIQLIENVLEYLIYIVAAPIAAIMFAIAGFNYLTAGDDMGKVKRAHDIFISVLWGFGIMLIAWALVSFVLNFFTGDNSTFNLLDAPAT